VAEQTDFNQWFKLDQLIWSCAISQAVHVAVELGLPELLQLEAKSAEEIATLTGSDAWALDAVLHALAAFDVLKMDATERFSLSEMGALLLKSGPALPGEAGAFFETIYRSLGALTHAVRTGEKAFDRAFGISFYEYLSREAEVGRFFNEQMVRNIPARYAGISSIFDFSRVSRVVDIGGGEGGLLLHLLSQRPHLKAMLFDLPGVVEKAGPRFKEAGLCDRCEIVGGSFLESVPEGGDLYMLAAVLNNLRDSDAAQLFANCRASMGPGTRLLILEPLRNFGERLTQWAALVGLGVMAQRGGRTRTEAQVRKLLVEARFELFEVRHYQSAPRTVIEAVPI